MISESARAASAAEARFRLDAPNSRPRSTRIIALDPAAERAIGSIADGGWAGARFLTLVATTPAGDGLEGVPIDVTLRDIDGREAMLAETLAAADAVVMIAGSAAGAGAAAVIGGACSARGILATGLVVESADAGGDGGGDAERALRSLRPHAAMLVVASGAEYIPEMLSALRA